MNQEKRNLIQKEYMEMKRFDRNTLSNLAKKHNVSVEELLNNIDI